MGGTTPLTVFIELPTLAARGEKAKALAEVAARAKRATFFIRIAIIVVFDLYDSIYNFDDSSVYYGQQSEASERKGGVNRK